MPETQHDTSDDHFILMDETAQPVPTANAGQLRHRGFRRMIPVLRATLAQTRWGRCRLKRSTLKDGKTPSVPSERACFASLMFRAATRDQGRYVSSAAGVAKDHRVTQGGLQLSTGVPG